MGDPTEHVNLAKVEADILAEMQEELAHLNDGLFRPDRGEATVDACKTANHNGGFFGPFVDIDDWYTPVAEPSPGHVLKDVVFEVVGSPVVKTVVEDIAQAIVPPMRTRLFGSVDACRSPTTTRPMPMPPAPVATPGQCPGGSLSACVALCLVDD